MIELFDAHERAVFGFWTLLRPLGESAVSSRWLAMGSPNAETMVVHRFHARGVADARRVNDLVEAWASWSSDHVAPIESQGIVAGIQPWAALPYTGDSRGLRTLGSLTREKGGWLEPTEAERAIGQILTASASAHAANRRHGAIDVEGVLVDRSGRLLVELYGLMPALIGESAPAEDVAREEVRSICAIAYQLLTGLRAEEPLIPAARLVRRLDRRWVDWLDRGLDPVDGFASAGEALSALPGRQPKTRPIPAPPIVRSVLERRATPSR